MKHNLIARILAVIAASMLALTACNETGSLTTSISSEDSLSFRLVKSIDIAGYRLAKMAMTNNYLLVLGSNSSGSGYLHTIDVSNPADPQYVAVSTGGGVAAWGGEFVVQSGTAYQVGWCCRFNSLDVSNPTAVVRSFEDTDNAPLNAGLTTIQVSGNYAYIGGQVNSAGDLFMVVDKSNPADLDNLVATLTLPASSDVVNFKIQGSYVYVKDRGDDKLYVVDVSTPTSPTLVNTISTGDQGTSDLDIADDLFVTSTNLYLTNINSKTVEIYSLSDPATPALVRTLTLDSPGKAVYVDNGILYVAAGDHGGSSSQHDYLYAYRLSDYQLLHRISIGNWPAGLLVHNGLVAVSIDFGGTATQHVEFYKLE